MEQLESIQEQAEMAQEYFVPQEVSSSDQPQQGQNQEPVENQPQSQDQQPTEQTPQNTPQEPNLPFQSGENKEFNAEAYMNFMQTQNPSELDIKPLFLKSRSKCSNQYSNQYSLYNNLCSRSHSSLTMM